MHKNTGVDRRLSSKSSKSSKCYDGGIICTQTTDHEITRNHRLIKCLKHYSAKIFLGQFFLLLRRVISVISAVIWKTFAKKVFFSEMSFLLYFTLESSFFLYERLKF